MPREIKFRGYDVDTKKWYYGGYTKFDKVTLCMATEKEVKDNEEYLILFQGFSDWNMTKPSHMADVDPESVGQYTGLKDKYGKEIYEGDILRDRESIVTIDFINGMFIAKYRTMNNLWKEYGSLHRYLCDYEDSANVIGNIYENPELLEG